MPATTAAMTTAEGTPPRVACPGSVLGVPACPDLKVDGDSFGEVFITHEAFDEEDCAVVEGLVAAGERRLVRFGVSTENVGAGDVVLGSPSSRPDLFTWSGCHRHHHLDAYAAYRLWTPEGYAAWVAARAVAPGAPASRVLEENPDVASAHVAGLKVGFCIVDIHPVVPRAVPRQYTSCSHQGLSAGWADHYAWYLDGQWIDVTGLPFGHYVLEVEVNPERVIEEATYEDNSASSLVHLWTDA